MGMLVTNNAAAENKNSMNTQIELTEASKAVFVKYANDAGNWSGMPMLDGNKEERGNLTDLKRKKLITTFRDEGIDWVSFTDLGVAYAATLGITITRM